MKELETLTRIRREAGMPYFSALYDKDMWDEDFRTIAKALQVLKIIKRKGIGVDVLRWSNTVAEYNSNAKASVGYTQEEYEDVVGVMI